MGDNTQIQRPARQLLLLGLFALILAPKAASAAFWKSRPPLDLTNLCPHKLAQPPKESSPYGDLEALALNPPPSLLVNASGETRTLMINALKQMMNQVRMKDSGSQSLNLNVINSIFYLELIGIPKEELHALIRVRLDAFLKEGRQHGLSSMLRPSIRLRSANRRPSPSSPSWMNFFRSMNPSNLKAEPFKQKYNMAEYSNARAILDGYDHWKPGDSLSGAYGGSLAEAFKLSQVIHDRPLGREILLHMIRLTHYEDAYNTADQMNHPQELFEIGMLALVDFFERSHKVDNVEQGYVIKFLEQAVESFSRIRGYAKPLAESVLTDLAHEITRPEVIRAAAQAGPYRTARSLESVRSSHRTIALRALRATGNSEGKVENPMVQQQIQQLVDLSMSDRARIDFSEIVQSLKAIGDADRLNKYGNWILQQSGNSPNPRLVYVLALDFFAAADNRVAAQRVFSLYQRDSLPDLTVDDYDILTRKMVELNDRQSLLQLDQKVDTRILAVHPEDLTFPQWHGVKSNIHRAVAGLPLEDAGAKQKPNIPESAQISHEMLIQLASEKMFRYAARIYWESQPTEKEKQALIAQGDEFAKRGATIDAKSAYLKAHDLDKLRELAANVTSNNSHGALNILYTILAIEQTPSRP